MSSIRDRVRSSRAYRNRHVQIDEGSTYFVDSGGHPHLIIPESVAGGVEQPVKITEAKFAKLREPGEPIVVLSRFDWSSKSEAQKSLAKLGLYVDAYTVGQIHWYANRSLTVRHLARTTRALVIIATAAAGLIPILSQLIQTNGKPDIAPAWSSVALAIAAALIAFDRYFGFSQSWMRYVTAQQQLESLQGSFAIDWADLPSKLGDPPTRIQIDVAITRAKTYITDVRAIVRRETAEWEREMTAALRQEEATVTALEEKKAADKAAEEKKAADKAPEEKKAADKAPEEKKAADKAPEEKKPGEEKTPPGTTP